MAARRGSGQGSVFQRHRPDCRLNRGGKTCECPWFATVDHGFIGGRRVRSTRAATRTDGKRPTKTDAYLVLEVMQREKSAGVVSSASPLSTWLEHWLEHVIEPSKLKASTKTYYRSYVDQWLKPMMGTVRLDKLGPDHVRGLHSAMRKAGKSPTTIRNAHATLRKALAVALAERRVQYNWAREVTAPDADDNPIAQLTIDEAGNVFVVASRDARELARVHVALLCGLRQGEALGLRWSDVGAKVLRVERSAARVDGKRVVQPPKTKRSVRDVPIPPAAQVSLAAWRKASGGRGYVFHGFDGPGAIEDASRDHRAWRAVLRDAGVPLVPLHGARGTCATLLESLGYPPRLIADVLGQADVRVTETHYARSDDWQRAAAMDEVGALFAIEG